MPRQKKQPGSQVQKPKNSVAYFSVKTDESVARFQDAPTLEIKNKVFLEEIQPAFAKLIENIIFVYKFHILRGCRTHEERLPIVSI